MVTRITPHHPTTPTSPATPTTPVVTAPVKPPKPPRTGGSDFRTGGAVVATTTHGTGTLPALGGLIDQSKTRLYLHMADVPPNDVMDKLIAAAQRGVDVHVVLNPTRRLDPGQVL